MLTTRVYAPNEQSWLYVAESFTLTNPSNLFARLSGELFFIIIIIISNFRLIKNDIFTLGQNWDQTIRYDSSSFVEIFDKFDYQ